MPPNFSISYRLIHEHPFDVKKIGFIPKKYLNKFTSKANIFAHDRKEKYQVTNIRNLKCHIIWNLCWMMIKKLLRSFHVQNYEGRRLNSEGFSTPVQWRVSHNRRFWKIFHQKFIIFYRVISCFFFCRHVYENSLARHQHEMLSWCGKSNAMNYDMQFPFVILYYTPLIFLSQTLRLPIWESQERRIVWWDFYEGAKRIKFHYNGDFCLNKIVIQKDSGNEIKIIFRFYWIQFMVEEKTTYVNFVLF